MNGRALVVLANDRRHVRGAEHAVLEHGVVTFTVNGITTSVPMSEIAKVRWLTSPPADQKATPA